MFVPPFKTLIIALLSFLIFCVTGAVSDEISPYGVCAHVSRHGDHELAEQEFKLMRRAGIGWARTDFDWTTVQPSETGPWDFSMLDATVERAEAAGIEILPILAYDVPWATPAYKHLDAWLEYVRKTVSRYQKQLRYWEVWNEPDLKQFWKEDPNPANYTILLKATYQEIKKIDPDLHVLVGGLSGIPYEYIEGIYKAGGKDFFDIMAVHPYRYPAPPEARSLKDDLDTLRQLMARYGDGDKPIWITEIGWPTHQNSSPLLDDVIRTGLKTAAPNITDWTLGVFDEPGYPVRVNLSDSRLIDMLPGGGQIEHLSIEQIKTLSPKSCQALLMPPEEGFAAGVFDAIETYIRDGGIIIFWQGVPLYYLNRQTDDGGWQQQGANESFRRRLHIGWQAWWTQDGVPKSIGTLKVPEPFQSQIHLPENSIPAERFLTDTALKPGDRFIPLLQASEGNYTGTAAAVFDLDSDMNGAVIVSTLMQDFRGISEERQAMILPRATLIALHSGVERMFWYNFRARENNPYYNEDNFGIIHKDLAPKPAYRAMRTLSRIRPAGSKPLDIDWQSKTVYYPGWTRPDGQTAWAIWTSGTARDVIVEITGEVTDTADYLGKSVDIKKDENAFTISVSETPVYLIGPDTLVPASK